MYWPLSAILWGFYGHLWDFFWMLWDSSSSFGIITGLYKDPFTFDGIWWGFYFDSAILWDSLGILKPFLGCLIILWDHYGTLQGSFYLWYDLMRILYRFHHLMGFIGDFKAIFRMFRDTLGFFGVLWDPCRIFYSWRVSYKDLLDLHRVSPRLFRTIRCFNQPVTKQSITNELITTNQHQRSMIIH